MKPGDYSIAAVVRACLADTWGKVSSAEFSEHKELVERHGPCSRAHAARLPAHALRDLTVAGVSGSNYLVPTGQAGYLPALQPASVVLNLGAETLDAGTGNIVLPTGTAGATTQWLADENAAITESQPTIGQTASSPKVLAALVEVSHQLLKQSNAERALRIELARSAGAAIDAAALAGSGASGQPLGIVNTPNVGTFTGTSLNRSALIGAQLDVLDSNAITSGQVGYVTTPTVADTLANRADTIESTSPVWRGPLQDGLLVGTRAMSTRNCPASTAIYGDWGNLSVVSWGAPEIAVDPFTKFNFGIVGIRLLLMVDIVVTCAAAFTVATSVS